ncbi:MAG: elongation factor P maturation arginine rhamnosyltransferase EarP [Sterolibacterium sp.]|nr:elongation factor P maturation arginine rhamnosyltransferase EarP [Sterolibacterium sp.]
MRGNNWDIFCSVVDNFGDIGVCWRLARQLAAEHSLQVRLWVDDLASFQRLCPEIDPLRSVQSQHGVEVRHWTAPLPCSEAGRQADVVIEAFACELPPDYLAAMAARPVKPVWINLEYLSAEDWVSGCHGAASPHPRLPLTKHFFFPGFTTGSGSLLREAGLIPQRKAWQADPEAAWRQLGMAPAKPDETSVSLFCYDNPALPELLDAWSAGDAQLRCLIPEGKALAQAAGHLCAHPLQPGDSFRQGNLTVYALPFLSQENYDRLLWSCDLNFVRGEDSFVRAQWAARPSVWHIYPQEDAAHHAKLNAFLDMYCTELSAPAAAACRSFWQLWNQATSTGMVAAWPEYWRHRTELSRHATHWASRLAEQVDLASQLVNFCENLL